MKVPRFLGCLVAVLALCTAPSLSAQSSEELSERVRASIRNGTGGETAAYALCQLQAIVDFKDGHLTPELIPQWQRFERWAIVEDIAEPSKKFSGDGWRLIEQSRSRLKSLVEAFRQESRRLALLQDENKAEWKRQSSRLSNRASAESEALARELLEALRESLSRGDDTALQSELERFAATMVVSRFDHSKLDFERKCR